MTGIGYLRFSKVISQEMNIKHKSIKHNTRKVFEILSKWGIKQIKNEGYSSLRESVRNAGIKC